MLDWLVVKSGSLLRRAYLHTIPCCLCLIPCLCRQSEHLPFRSLSPACHAMQYMPGCSVRKACTVSGPGVATPGKMRGSGYAPSGVPVLLQPAAYWYYGKAWWFACFPCTHAGSYCMRFAPPSASTGRQRVRRLLPADDPAGHHLHGHAHHEGARVCVNCVLRCWACVGVCGLVDVRGLALLATACTGVPFRQVRDCDSMLMR